jgi:hypothetical protein
VSVHQVVAAVAQPVSAQTEVEAAEQPVRPLRLAEVEEELLAMAMAEVAPLALAEAVEVEVAPPELWARLVAVAVARR